MLKHVINTERYDFADARQLRDWLNELSDDTLDTLLLEAPDGGSGVTLYHDTVALSDGSTVCDLRVSGDAAFK